MKHLKYYQTLADAQGEIVSSPGAIHIKDVHSAVKFTGTKNQLMYVNQQGFFTDGNTPDPAAPDKGKGEVSSAYALTYTADDQIADTCKIFTIEEVSQYVTSHVYDKTTQQGIIYFNSSATKLYIPAGSFLKSFVITKIYSLDIPLCFSAIEAASMPEDLTSISLPKSIAYMDINAFNECQNLQYVYWDIVGNPNDTTYKWDMTPVEEAGRGYFTANVCKETLTKIEFGPHVECIIPYFIQGCEQIQEMLIPENIHVVYHNAFENSGLLRFKPTEKFVWITGQSVWGNTVPTDLENTYTNYILEFFGENIFAGCPMKNMYMWHGMKFIQAKNVFGDTNISEDSLKPGFTLFVLDGDQLNPEADTYDDACKLYGIYPDKTCVECPNENMMQKTLINWQKLKFNTPQLK